MYKSGQPVKPPEHGPLTVCGTYLALLVAAEVGGMLQLVARKVTEPGSLSGCKQRKQDLAERTHAASPLHTACSVATAPGSQVSAAARGV